MKKCNILLTALGLYFCSSLYGADTVPGCEKVGNAQGICGFPAPEDIDVFPDGKHLLFSPVAGMGNGDLLSLYLFDISTNSAEPIQYTQQKTDKAEQLPNWGDSGCDSPPGEQFSPHGVHISQRSGGAWQVLAVNHVRESIELFEIIEGVKPELTWRGCVITPAKSNINDVVALPDGGLLVSHMVDRGSMDIMEAMQATENTGYIWRWQPGRGFDKLPGSDGIVPNGVAMSADGQSVFIAETGGQRIRKIDYLSGEQQASVKLGPVDNLSWAADGRLIATRVIGPMPADCFSKPGPCLTPFEVVALDPDTLEFSVLHEQIGKPMGAASVAVVLDNTIYVGSFKGHQILRVALPEKAAATVTVAPDGDKGFPFMASGLDLAAFGYTEQEFFIEGNAQGYSNDGDFGDDGKWNAKPNPDAIAAYKTRILVRSPAPEKFNGSVIVEWLNVSSGMDVTPDWSMTHVEYLREGYAYVGVSAQYLGVEFNRAWDNARYGELLHPGDSFSYDIYSQVGETIVRPRENGPRPMGKLTSKIKALIASGESQSAARMLTYVNAIHPIKPVYQGFLIHSALSSAKLSQKTAAVNLTEFWKTIDVPAGVPVTEKIEVPDGDGTVIRSDLKVPVLIVNSEADVNGYFGYPGFRHQPDSEYFRLWELAGTAHADQYIFKAGIADGLKSDVSFPIECSGAPINRGPQTYAMRAAVHAINRWIRYAEPPPSGSRFQTDGRSLVRDPSTGIVTSGIKLPQVAVPVETLTGRRPLRSIFSSPFCILFGATDAWNGDSDSWDDKWFMDPLSKPEPIITQMYPSKIDYLKKFNVALSEAIVAGFVRPADREEIYRQANDADFW